MKTIPLVIYHAGCADGFTAAWVFHQHFGGEVEFHPGVYSEAPPDVFGRDVYLVDFSYKRAVVAQLINEADSVTFIDHHITALNDLADLKGLKTYTDLERSGAMLAWDFLNPGQPAPALVEYIQDRDLWLFKLDGTHEISAVIFAHEFTFENWDLLSVELETRYGQLHEQGRALLMKQRKDISDLLKQTKRRMVINGHDVPVANIPSIFASDAGHILSKGEPFSATYTDTATHRAFSLRSSDEGLDVSEIAASYGGGGHRNASGFKVPRDHDLARS